MHHRRWAHFVYLILLLVLVGCASQPCGGSAAPPGDGTGLEKPEILGDVAHWVARGIEMMGISIIVVGAVAASVLFVRQWIGQRAFLGAYQRYRERLGQAILLGLEFLVAADIIGTVAVDPSFRNVGVLAAIVLIRTFLSFVLEVEISGRWPWEVKRGREGE